MAKEWCVVRNGKYVVDRVDSKTEAEATALELLQASPNSSFEFGKMDKRMFAVRTDASYEYGEEPY